MTHSVRLRRPACAVAAATAVLLVGGATTGAAA
ncbi:peptidase M28, partial [Streptomyces sp. SID9944]|nr:peptidase M28 [Streptomyces sp. SID9944]